MGRDANTRALKDSEILGGFFSLPDVDWDVPGLLSWSEDGAKLELIESHAAWPRDLRARTYTVHGRIETLDVTLLGAWTQGVSLGDVVKRVLAPTLAVGAWVQEDDRWPDAIYSTAHLSEWRSDSGLRYSRARPLWKRLTRRKSLGALRIEVGRATRDEFELAGAKVAFAGRTETSVAHSPDWSVATSQELQVTPAQPATMAELRQRFAEPLWSLTSFVADRPDSVTREILIDRGTRTRVEVWRAGAVVEPREWRGDAEGYLFDAAFLADFPASIMRWWALHDAAWPALGVYAESIGHSRTYTPARLITVYSAVERYAKTRHATADLKVLRDYAGVPSEVTGATNRMLRLLDASRGYWAHLDEPVPQAQQKHALTRSEFEDGLLPSTRIAGALLQACLLRDLGFDAVTTQQILARYYASWPLP